MVPRKWKIDRNREYSVFKECLTNYKRSVLREQIDFFGFFLRESSTIRYFKGCSRCHCFHFFTILIQSANWILYKHLCSRIWQTLVDCQTLTESGRMWKILKDCPTLSKGRLLQILENSSILCRLVKRKPGNRLESEFLTRKKYI